MLELNTSQTLFIPAANAVSTSFDKSFMGEVQAHFFSTGLSLNTILAVLCTLAGVGVILGISKIAGHFSQKEPHFPASWISNTAALAHLLELAVSQRQKITLHFQGLHSDAARQGFVASFSEISKESLNLELSHYPENPQAWANRKMRCAFQLPRQSRPGHMDFFYFVTTSKQMTPIDNGMGLLSVQPPDHIEMGQKRLALRIAPPLQLVCGIALWPDKSDGQNPERAIVQLGRPALVYSPQQEEPLLRLINISAGGVRISMHSGLAQEMGLILARDKRFVVLFQLKEPEHKKKLNIWTICEIRNVFKDYETRGTELGMQFKKVGKINKNGKDIDWKAVPEDGIVSLGNWVAQRHLELYREKGLT